MRNNNLGIVTTLLEQFGMALLVETAISHSHNFVDKEAIEIDYRNRLRNWLSGMLTDLGAQLNDSIENTEPVNVITSAPENQ